MKQHESENFGTFACFDHDSLSVRARNRFGTEHKSAKPFELDDSAPEDHADDDGRFPLLEHDLNRLHRYER